MTKAPAYNVGELRPTQMLFTYGIGAIVDLPYLSALVMGLDDWPADPGLMPEINEDRLLRAVRQELGTPVQALRALPVTPETSSLPRPLDEPAQVGVPVANFPRWLLCPQCRLLAPISSGLFELKHELYHPDRARYRHINCPKAPKPPTAVPARFLVACENGHLDDFPWVEYVHGGPTACTGILTLIEYGPTGEARDLEIRCTCGKSRRLSEAFGESGQQTLPRCRGRRPHLRDYDLESCTAPLKAILLGASNLWFPDVLTSLAIPTESAQLAQWVADHWATLKYLQTLQNVILLRQIGQLGDLHGYTNEELWDAIQAKRAADEQATEAEPLDLRGPEWELFTHPAAARPTETFRVREVAVPEGFASLLERIVLVERMREVRALIGFTRIDAPGELGEVNQMLAGRRMHLSRTPPTWVPAAEVRGEGIFIQFKESALQTWLARPAVRERDAHFWEAHRRWRQARGIKPPEEHYPGMRYVLLHSFAHALMRQFALECGYTAASVRERLYSRNPDADHSPRAGVLLYTAAPDSEGTLGGLVNLGEPDELRRHLSAALQAAALCASDPLCAEHQPGQQGITLHAAACHACLFAPETSCERGNKYLDRSTLTPTIDQEALAFFEVAL